VRNAQGFTVIEILVALALLGLGLLFFVRFSLLSLGLREESRGLSESIVLAQTEMEHLLAYGWGAASSSCLSEERVGTLSRCLKEGVMKGRSYRIVMERREEDSRLERYLVTCRRIGDGGPRRQVRLLTLRRRTR